MRSLVVFALMILTATSFADANACKPSSPFQELLACAEAQAPEVQSAELELARAKAQVSAAGQLRNPEFALETFQGNINGEKREETDLSLGIPIELGGKISARTSAANAGVTLSEARLYQARAKVRSELVTKLHRLRQVLHEGQIAEEAIGTFSKLIQQFASRPALSPEQQLSSSVFRLSKGEYDLKRSATQDEILELDSYFRLHTGLGVDSLKSSLPQIYKTWPRVAAPTSAKASPEVRIQQSELDLALAELESAQSEAWPTLTIGPSMKVLNEAGAKNNLMGLNLSLPLPVFNTNGGGRAVGRAGVELSKTKQSFVLREQLLRRETAVKIYEQTVKSLETSISHEEIERRHVDAEKLFLKGVVPSALVIETHRTSFELEKVRHERELKAIETLLEIYTIDGTILENNL